MFLNVWAINIFSVCTTPNFIIFDGEVLVNSIMKNFLAILVVHSDLLYWLILDSFLKSALIPFNKLNLFNKLSLFNKLNLFNKLSHRNQHASAIHLITFLYLSLTENFHFVSQIFPCFLENFGTMVAFVLVVFFFKEHECFD